MQSVCCQDGWCSAHLHVEVFTRLRLDELGHQVFCRCYLGLPLSRSVQPWAAKHVPQLVLERVIIQHELACRATQAMLLFLLLFPYSILEQHRQGTSKDRGMTCQQLPPAPPPHRHSTLGSHKPFPDALLCQSLDSDPSPTHLLTVRSMAACHCAVNLLCRPEAAVSKVPVCQRLWPVMRVLLVKLSHVLMDDSCIYSKDGLTAAHATAAFL
ncbi:hypothetical protein V8C86DRAFT_362555 [Haematococcus lacustris]